jgi:hypothetical protein
VVPLPKRVLFKIRVDVWLKGIGILPQLDESFVKFCFQHQKEDFGKLQMHCSEFHQ